MLVYAYTAHDFQTLLDQVAIKIAETLPTTPAPPGFSWRPIFKVSGRDDLKWSLEWVAKQSKLEANNENQANG